MRAAVKGMLILFGVFVVSLCAVSAQAERDYSGLVPAFERLTVQHEGRIKPLDTFARAHLLLLAEDTELELYDEGGNEVGEMSAMEWMIELMLYPQEAYDRRAIKEWIPEVIQALDLEEDEEEGYYSFFELSAAFSKKGELMEELRGKDSEDLSVVEKRIVTLYRKVVIFFDLSRSVTGLFRDIPIGDSRLASELNLTEGQSISYFEMLNRRSVLGEKIESLMDMDESERAEPYSVALMELVGALRTKMQSAPSSSFRVILPEEFQKTADWAAPWSLLQSGSYTEFQAKQVSQWEDLVSHAQNGRVAEALEVSGRIAENLQISLPIGTELSFYKGNYFGKSQIFYIISFVLLVLSMAVFRKWLYRASLTLLGIGLALHLVGIVMRVIILERPPVATLYESVVVVGFILVAAAFVVELILKNAVALFVGGFAGFVLHYIGSQYASEGDTMGMLVAVLNSRFWLSTHVLTIIFGYSFTLFSGTIAHVYLVLRAIRYKDAQFVKTVYQAALGTSFVALLFTTIGTILGGIWGDQSWGRFWGWDPKENGALLIVLWLLIIIHGRLAGYLREIGYAAGLALTNICVALAWFGVNLLQVGLHSYGFDDGVVTNLSLYCFGEVAFVFALVWLIRFRGKSPMAASS